jgi:hypothetical protein
MVEEDEAMDAARLERVAASMRGLEVLDVKEEGDHREELLGVPALHRLPNLRVLRLPWCTKLTDIEAVGTLSHLTELDLGGCTVLGDESLATISSCVSLTALDLSYSDGLSDEGLLLLAPLVKLVTLDLTSSRSPITGTGLQHFSVKLASAP